MRPQNDIFIAQFGVAAGNESHHIGIPARIALETLHERFPFAVVGTWTKSHLFKLKNDIGRRKHPLVGTRPAAEHPVGSERTHVSLKIGTGFRYLFLRRNGCAERQQQRRKNEPSSHNCIRSLLHTLFERYEKSGTKNTFRPGFS